jgi:hypothetical protein
VEISINAKQIIALIWTMVALVISIVVVFAMYIQGPDGPWYYLVALFFGLFLVITVPVYLLVALWHIVSKWDST